MKPPYTKWINDIKAKLGFNRTMTASGEDVVDAVNKQSRQIGDLTQLQTTAKNNIVNAVNSTLPIFTTDDITVVSPYVTNLNSEIVKIGNILICSLFGQFTQGTINDGDVLFTINDNSFVFATDSYATMQIGFAANGTGGQMIHAVNNTRNICAWNNKTYEVARRFYGVFVTKIKEV